MPHKNATVAAKEALLNITLSAPPEIICEIRAWAEENGTSLNDYIRDCLTFKASEIRAERLTRAEKFRAFALANPISVPKGFRFSRAETNERKARNGK